ncbi:hypothetical protein [uncultured Maribacter sp.]|uniref:hypothetical protein n=1 Tax=uncultured Maribacter sp. TaxID=431308 RepID=UPI0030DCB5A5|tara:strand:- start:822 stop:1004 length:183 start_codon:yes stop_codon:yes gene_type:complete
MKAPDVYTIAKALPPEEFALLYDMLKSDLKETNKIKKSRKKLPEYSVEDALQDLLKHHIK